MGSAYVDSDPPMDIGETKAGGPVVVVGLGAIKTEAFEVQLTATPESTLYRSKEPTELSESDEVLRDEDEVQRCDGGDGVLFIVSIIVDEVKRRQVSGNSRALAT